MFRIEVTGDAPGVAHLVHTYDNRATAERVAKALLYYFDRNKLPDHHQGVQVLDRHGQRVWRQIVGSKPERVN